jgi:phospholipase C
MSKPYITPSTKPPMLPNSPSDYSGNISTLGSNTGPWAQPGICLSEYSDPQAPVPWGPENANQNLTLLVEEGFKPVRGRLSEGRYLTFEAANLALTNVDGKTVGVSAATANHEDIRQRWIVNAVGDLATTSTFTIQSALDKTYISGFPLGFLTSDVTKAQAFTFSYTPNGATYSVSLRERANSFVSLLENIESAIAWDNKEAGQFKIYSVSYH